MITKRKVLRKLIKLRNFCANKDNAKIEIQKAQQQIDEYLEIKRQIEKI